MPENPIDLSRLSDILKRAGAEKVMPYFRNLNADNIREKSSATDLVTDADEEAEAFIRREIEQLAPEILFVGEEAVAKDRGLLTRLRDADLAIVVDPIDGTANFAAGLPLFAVMAAIVVKNEVVVAAIHDPVSGDTIGATKGEGAVWMLADGETRKIQVSWPVPLEESIGVVSTVHFDEKEKGALHKRLDQAHIVANYRNAGHEYRLLATGGSHYSVYSRLMPWDHAPGSLIVTEAGGYVACSDGEPYDPSRHDAVLVAACSERTHQYVTTRLLGVEKGFE